MSVLIEALSTILIILSSLKNMMKFVKSKQNFHSSLVIMSVFLVINC